MVTLRRLYSLVTLTLLLASGYAILPRAAEIFQLFVLRGDPATVMLYRVSGLDVAQFETEIAAALSHEDPELARSLAQLASDQGHTIDHSTLEQIAEAEEFSLMRSGRQFLSGAWSGTGESPTEFAGAFASDLTVIGDLRDLVEQGLLYPEQDNVTVALAATGVALTGALVASGGTSAAGKAGVSAIKVARKMGRLSKGLERHLVRLTADAIDSVALRSITRSLGRWDAAGAANQVRRLIKPAVVDELADAARSVQKIAGNQGYRATLQALETADDTRDLARLGKASERLGSKFRATLLLKRGGKLVLEIAELVWTFAGWIISGAGWLVWALYKSGRVTFVVIKSGVRMAARVWRGASINQLAFPRIEVYKHHKS